MNSGKIQQWFYIFLFLVLVGAGVFRIISTYQTFSQTWDEPAHIACGLEFLSNGSYTYEYQHPPLSRIAVAVGPYLAGIRSYGLPDMWKEGDKILHAGDTYTRNLTLARIGILPFFIGASFLVFLAGYIYFDKETAVLSTFLFTTIPPVLAHAGLATTDMAFTATFFGAILSFLYLLENPTGIRSAIFGAFVGLSLYTKFSTVVFFPSCAVFLIISGAYISRKDFPGKLKHCFRLKHITLMTLFAVFLVWGGYGFSTGPIKYARERPHELVDKVFGQEGALHDYAYALVEAPIIPAPEVLWGINQVRIHNESGHWSYLFGEIRRTGWWYFFIVALFVKTPIPLLLLSGIGTFILFRAAVDEGDWRKFAFPICAAALIVACLPSRLTLGIRHLLPIYPFLAVTAGAGAIRLWRTERFRSGKRTLLVGMMVWQLAVGMACHPDYIPYFNELAGKHPDRILAESDLDLGQDVGRLSRRIQELQIDTISVAINGSANLARLLPAEVRPMKAYEKTRGWVAISVWRTKYDGTGKFPYKGYNWLEAYTPSEYVGKSIKLYYIKPL